MFSQLSFSIKASGVANNGELKVLWSVVEFECQDMRGGCVLGLKVSNLCLQCVLTRLLVC